MINFGQSLHVDHVVPLSKGGMLKPGNVVLLCRSCNIKKYNNDLYNLPWKMCISIARAATAFDIHIRMLYGAEYSIKFFIGAQK